MLFLASSKFHDAKQKYWLNAGNFPNLSLVHTKKVASFIPQGGFI
jgi:hypothetical protein